MEPRKKELSTLYEAKQFRKSRLHVNKFYLFSSVFLLLITFRFLNLYFWWHVNKMELTKNCATKSVQYTFLNFSSYDQAGKKKVSNAQKSEANDGLSTTLYFNFLHPLVFLVQNRNTETSAVDLGRLTIILEPGFYYGTLSLSDFITVRNLSSNSSLSRHLGTSLLSKFFPTPIISKKNDKKKALSFIIKSPGNTSYIKLPYLVYLLVPLIIIFLLVFSFSRAVWTSFFYFPILALLFDVREVFFRIPLSLFFKDFPNQLYATLEIITLVLLLLIFLAAAVTGLFNWNQRKKPFAETFIVIIFLLLPFILRF